MIEEGRECDEILQQLAAIRAAAHRASLQLMRSYAVECIRAPESSPEEMVETLINVLSRVS